MNYYPFVRRVGIGANIYQSNKTKAYDHRLICFLNGGGNIYIDGAWYDAEACCIYLIKPGTEYRVCCAAGQSVAVINFDTTYEYAHLGEPILSVESASFNPEKVLNTEPFRFLKDKTFICNDDLLLLYRMHDVYLRNDLAEDVKRFCLTAQLSHILARASLCESDSKPTAISSAIYKYIIDNAHKKISISEVARRFNYSSSFIEKNLRKNYNSSFKQLIIETRLKRALWLLENTDLSCSEIASQLGFSSAQHFSASFINKYGKRPSEYK